VFGIERWMESGGRIEQQNCRVVSRAYKVSIVAMTNRTAVARFDPHVRSLAKDTLIARRREPDGIAARRHGIEAHANSSLACRKSLRLRPVCAIFQHRRESGRAVRLGFDLSSSLCQQAAIKCLSTIAGVRPNAVLLFNSPAAKIDSFHSGIWVSEVVVRESTIDAHRKNYRSDGRREFVQHHRSP
jgi:hypothetical protein